MQCQEQRLLILLNDGGEALLFFSGDGQGVGGVGHSGNTIIFKFVKK
jgi:hypothetical protein